jgi:hypothetical protein
LTPPAAQTVNESSALAFSVAATDPDLPANSFTFALSSAPAGMTIDPATGAITWTPTEEQGPGTNTISVIVRDNGTPPLEGTGSVAVVVNEVNTAPSFATIADTSLHFGDSLSLQAAGSDPDIPANTLSYSLEQGPEGLSIDASIGAITWSPSPNQVGNHSITVRVADNGSPSLNASATFRVTVTGEGSRVDAQRLASGLVQITISGDIGQTYELQRTQQLRGWEKVIEFRLDTSPFQYIDPESGGGTRFFRLRLVPAP